MHAGAPTHVWPASPALCRRSMSGVLEEDPRGLREPMLGGPDAWTRGLNVAP